MLTPQTYSEQLNFLPGGVRAGILRVNGDDMVHRVALNQYLYEFIRSEAKSHDAAFEGNNFEKILDAVSANKIHAYFLVVSWENCHRRFAGGAIEIPTAITEWDGQDFKHYPAVYGEDTCVSAELSGEFRTRTNGMGLGTYFIGERIKHSILNVYGDLDPGMACRGRVGEYAADNRLAYKMLRRFGATLGVENEDGVFLIDKVDLTPSECLNDIWLKKFSSHSGNIFQNIFAVDWAGNSGDQRISASFTDAISTFTGQPIVRVQFKSNGELPSDAKLQDVLKTLILVGQNIIAKRDWMMLPADPRLAANEVISTMRIHVLHEPQIVRAWKMMDATERFLGPHPMVPVVTNFKNTPCSAIGMVVADAEPFNVVRSDVDAVDMRNEVYSMHRPKLAFG